MSFPSLERPAKATAALMYTQRDLALWMLTKIVWNIFILTRLHVLHLLYSGQGHGIKNPYNSIII